MPGDARMLPERPTVSQFNEKLRICSGIVQCEKELN